MTDEVASMMRGCAIVTCGPRDQVEHQKPLLCRDYDPTGVVAVSEDGGCASAVGESGDIGHGRA